MPQTATKRGISVWCLQRHSALSLLWSWAKPPELWARSFCWFKPQSLWNFRVALGNGYGQLQWFLVFIIFYYCVCRICVLGRCLYHSIFVEEGRGQLCRVSSLLPTLTQWTKGILVPGPTTGRQGSGPDSRAVLGWQMALCGPSIAAYDSSSEQIQHFSLLL